MRPGKLEQKIVFKNSRSKCKIETVSTLRARKSCVNARGIPPAAYQVLDMLGGVPHPRFGGGTLSQVRGDTLSQVRGRGDTPSQIQGGVYYPILGWGGYPIPGLGGTPILGQGGPPGTLQPEMGYPLARPGMGYPPGQTWDGYPPCHQT